MKEIYLVAKGKDKDYYQIAMTFDSIDDAEKYIDHMQFYTSDDLWIITVNNYFKGEYKIDDDRCPLVTAFLDSEKNVFRVQISDQIYKNPKESRFGNLFTFYLPRNKKEKLKQYLIRAKEIAIEKQQEWLKNNK